MTVVQQRVRRWWEREGGGRKEGRGTKRERENTRRKREKMRKERSDWKSE